jgi:tol-pal system protein YbgF
MHRVVVLLAGAIWLVGTAAHAQEDGAAGDRLNRLERDLNFLQRQVYRTGAVGEGGEGHPPVNGASLEIRLSQMHEEIRALRGQLEQAQFNAKHTADELKKLSADVDYRLQAIEQKQAAAVVPAPAPSVDAQTNGFSPNDAGASLVEDSHPAKSVDSVATTGRDFPDANAHYNHAFRLLNEKNYSAAASSFDAFVKKYPADPLAGNAYYWLGESHYARADYTRAAEGFRKGYEANPEGQKAGDNLLKLGLSLAQVKRVPEACIVLSQVATKYAQSHARSAARAEKKRVELQCK